MKWLYLCLGSIAGGVSRYWVAKEVYKKMGAAFPAGTLVVNLTGCLLIGVFYSLAEDKLVLGENERLLLMTGFCGAYTTFSTLMLETSLLIRTGEWGRATLNIAASVVAGFVLFRVGEWLGRAI